MDWKYYKLCLKHVLQGFPMIKLMQVTEDDFTISINTSNNKVKNKVVKALGKKLANDPSFVDFVVFRYGSHHLIIEKK